MHQSRRAFLATTGTVTVAGCLGGGNETTLNVGIVPDVDPDTAIEQNTALGNYLESALDVGVELQTSADYAGMVRAMVADQVDIAYYGGVSYILAHARAGAEPVVVGEEDGKTAWHSAFIVPADSAIESMSDVQDSAGEMELVFGDAISTSGTVMPTYYLNTEYGLNPETDFASVTNVGAHDATAKTINSGSGDLGALNARIYDSLREDGQVQDVREVWRSPGFPDYPWAVAPEIEAVSVEEVRTAFTSLNQDEHGDILDAQNVDQYVPVSHDDFTSLETAVEMAGIETSTETEAA
jgi:phosphonate transport system substrate-binding protein